MHTISCYLLHLQYTTPNSVLSLRTDVPKYICVRKFKLWTFLREKLRYQRCQVVYIFRMPLYPSISIVILDKNSLLELTTLPVKPKSLRDARLKCSVIYLVLLWWLKKFVNNNLNILLDTNLLWYWELFELVKAFVIDFKKPLSLQKNNKILSFVLKVETKPHRLGFSVEPSMPELCGLKFSFLVCFNSSQPCSW